MDNISSGNFGDKLASQLTPVDSEKQLVSVTDTREIPDYYQQHIDYLNKTISELKTASEKDSKKSERIIRRLRFRLSLFSMFWFLTVLGLSGVFAWFGFRWYNQLQLQKQLATFSPEKIQEIEQIRTDVNQLSQTVIPQLQTAVKTNQEEIVKANSKIDKSRKSMSVLVKAMQELINSPDTENSAANQKLEIKPNPLQQSPKPESSGITPNS
ncbi:MAG: hypothetical protein KI793_29945 [Rivularia sp. (in: Bacteria)]|nr:hypothetical protein [Rivularia sp. MS3]